MDGSDARRPSPAAPILMIVGAALILIGSLVAWYRLGVALASVGVSRSVTITGVRTNPGKLFLVVALVVAALGAAAWSSGSASTKRMLALIAAVAAAFVGVIAVYDILTPRSQVIDASAHDLGGAGGGFVFRRIIEGLFARGIIKIDVQLGLWVVVGGAVLALIGSLLAAATARSVETSSVMGAAAPATAPATGWSSGMSTATPAGAPMAPEAAPPTDPIAEETNRPPDD